MTLLKWKPPHLNSFDFLFRVTQDPNETIARLMVVNFDDEIEFNSTGSSTIVIRTSGQ